MAHPPSTTLGRPEGGHERVDKIKKKFGQTGPRQNSFERFRSQASARSSTGSERHIEADIILLERQLASSARRITPELGERFAALMPQRLREGGRALQRNYVRSIVGTRRVKDLIRSDREDHAGYHGRPVADHRQNQKAARQIDRRGRTRYSHPPGTATRKLGLIGGVLTYAINLGVIDHNPAHGIKKPKYKGSRT